MPLFPQGEVLDASACLKRLSRHFDFITVVRFEGKRRAEEFIRFAAGTPDALSDEEATRVRDETCVMNLFEGDPKTAERAGRVLMLEFGPGDQESGGAPDRAHREGSQLRT